MRKITLLVLIFVTTLSVAQEEKEEKYPQDVDKKHELKINVTNLLIYEWFDVSYEYLINEESSFGASALLSLDSDNYFLWDNYQRKFSLTTYYRRYFSQKFARGFFVEGFGMLHTFERRDSNYDDYNNNYTYTNETGFSLGISVGGKFVSKSGFTTEIYMGLGRILGNNTDTINDRASLEAVTRGGVSLGYRF